MRSSQHLATLGINQLCKGIQAPSCSCNLKPRAKGHGIKSWPHNPSSGKPRLISNVDQHLRRYRNISMFTARADALFVAQRFQ